ncbi:MAG: hypothetical protein WC595_04250 [Candidatus Nanoarchaeia archaeon]
MNPLKQLYLTLVEFVNPSPKEFSIPRTDLGRAVLTNLKDRSLMERLDANPEARRAACGILGNESLCPQLGIYYPCPAEPGAYERALAATLFLYPELRKKYSTPL